MDMSVKLSIVIPVYNVEKYISRCLESVINQDLDNSEYEIIIVNDGSPDNSVAIAEEYQKLHSNIRIINRKNGGLSAARNTGFDAACGEYVWFVDSDDRIEPNCIDFLVNKAEQDSLDVLCFNLKKEFPNGRIEEFVITNDGELKLHSGENFLCQVGMPPAAWAAIYKREFLINSNLRFYEGILHEDQEFTPRAYTLAKRIEFVNRSVYYYSQRDGGIMKSRRDAQRCKDLLTVADSLHRFATEQLQPHSPIYRSIIYRVYFCVTQSLAFQSDDHMPLSEYRRKPYYPFDTSIIFGMMKYKLKLANMSLTLYKIIHSLFKIIRL